MSNIHSLTMMDGGANPVSQTFTPVNKDASGVWTFENQAGEAGVLGFQRVTASLTRSSLSPKAGSSDRVSRVRLGFHLPQVLFPSGQQNGYTAPIKLDYVPRANLEFILSDRTPPEVRYHLVAYIQNVFANTCISNMIIKGENAY